MVEDRFTKGFVAGAIGGLAITLLNMLVDAVGIHIVRWVDWMGVILFDHPAPFTWVETFISLIGMVSFNGALGIGFFYLIPLITNRNLLLKGWLWGVSIWFVLDGITSVFKVEGLTNLPIIDVVVDYASASLFGLFLARLQYRYEHAGAAARLSPEPAMKPLPGGDEDDAE